MITNTKFDVKKRKLQAEKYVCSGYEIPTFEDADDGVYGAVFYLFRPFYVSFFNHYTFLELRFAAKRHNPSAFGMHERDALGM